MPLTDEQNRILAFFADQIKQIKSEHGNRFTWNPYRLDAAGNPTDYWLYGGKLCFYPFITSVMTNKIPAPPDFYVSPKELRWKDYPRSYRYCFVADVDNNRFNILLIFNFPSESPNLLFPPADTNRPRVINSCIFWRGVVYQCYYPLKALYLEITPENIKQSFTDLFAWEEKLFGTVSPPPPPGNQPGSQDPDPPPPPPDVDPIHKQAYDKLIDRAKKPLDSNPTKSAGLTAEAKRLYPDVHAWYENQKAIKAQQE
jgi:hypothetical protein